LTRRDSARNKAANAQLAGLLTGPMLRQRAEARLKAITRPTPEVLRDQSAEGNRAIVHELQVHQIELEMQHAELMSAHMALEKSRASYFDLYDLAPVGYCTVNGVGLIVQANLTLARLLGVARGALVKQPIRRFIGKADQDIFHLLRTRLLADTAVCSGDTAPVVGSIQDPHLEEAPALKSDSCELRMSKGDGAFFWALLAATGTHDEQGALILRLSVSDISVRMQAEQQLTERTRQLEQADRAKSEFMNNVTHELRTPLNSVIGFSELLKDEVPGPLNAKQAGFVADIHDSGLHLLKLVDGILDMAQLDADAAVLERQPVDIGAAVQERLAVHRTAAEARGVTLGMAVAADAGSVQLDPNALRRILDALLDNAVKFNREGGTVRVSAQRADSMLEIAVADTGIGIAPADLPKLFQPLVQLDATLARKYGGIGLGLALAQRLAERHGGTIEVSSDPGKGSTFTLRLPLQEEKT